MSDIVVPSYALHYHINDSNVDCQCFGNDNLPLAKVDDATAVTDYVCASLYESISYPKGPRLSTA